MKIKYMSKILSLQKYLKKKNLKRENLTDIAGAIIGDNKTEMTDGEIALIIFDELKDRGFDEIKRTKETIDTNSIICRLKETKVHNLSLKEEDLIIVTDTTNNLNFYKINLNNNIYYFQKILLDRLLSCFDLNQTDIFKGKDCIILEEKEKNSSHKKEEKILKRGCLMRYVICEDKIREVKIK